MNKFHNMTIVRRSYTIDLTKPLFYSWATIDAGFNYYCDDKRHLVCKPYSIQNLHKMAAILEISRSFYHLRGRLKHPHYDIPIRRREEIEAQCYKVSRRDILIIIKGEHANRTLF